MKHFFLLFTLLIVGCCPKPVMEVRTDTLRIYQPETHDTLILVQNDTIWSAANDRYFIRVDTLLKKVYVKQKADTVLVAYRDTVTVFQQLPKTKSFLESIKDILIVALCLAVIGFLYKMFTGK